MELLAAAVGVTVLNLVWESRAFYKFRVQAAIAECAKR
jgi:hypothetical protein